MTSFVENNKMTIAVACACETVTWKKNEDVIHKSDNLIESCNENIDLKIFRNQFW